MLAVIPVLVEFPLIVSLVTKGRRQVFFAKLWSGLLAGGGAAGWLNTLANTGLRHLRSTDTDFGALEPSTLILNTSTLVLGVFVFVKCRNYLTSQTEQIRDMDCQ